MSHLPIPRGAERVLESLGADVAFRDDVLGDLSEEFAVRASWDGVPAARRWYYREALRLVPYFLRDFRRRFGWKTAERTFRMLLWSTLGGMVVDNVVVALTYRLVFLATGIPLNAYIRHWEIVGSPLKSMIWLALTVIVGASSGFIAASVDRHARLANTLIATATWSTMLVYTGWPVVPKAFLAMNLLTLIVATITGGLGRIMVATDR